MAQLDIKEGEYYDIPNSGTLGMQIMIVRGKLFVKCHESEARITSGGSSLKIQPWNSKRKIELDGTVIVR